MTLREYATSTLRTTGAGSSRPTRPAPLGGRYVTTHRHRPAVEGTYVTMGSPARPATRGTYVTTSHPSPLQGGRYTFSE
jgi:hypothetical protein